MTGRRKASLVPYTLTFKCVLLKIIHSEYSHTILAARTMQARSLGYQCQLQTHTGKNMFDCWRKKQNYLEDNHGRKVSH